METAIVRATAIIFACVLWIGLCLGAAFAETGLASHYGRESGPKTASGEPFNPDKLTCAMRTHNWRWVTVTNKANGKSIRCWVNDFGPAAWTGKIIDVSTAAAKALGFYSAGVARVMVE